MDREIWGGDEEREGREDWDGGGTILLDGAAALSS
jgi:hypothetical protein